MKYCWKKYISLIVLASLLLSYSLGSVCVLGGGDVFLPPDAGQRELVLNGSFEKTENGEAKYWALSNGKWGEKPGAIIVPDGGYGGSGTAVKLSTTDSARDIYITHKIKTVPGAVYQVSFWVKIDSMADNAGIKFTLSYDKTGVGNVGSYNPTYTIKHDVGHEWVQYVHHFTAQGAWNGVSSFRVRLIGDRSEVYVDDVSVYAIKETTLLPQLDPPPTQIVPDPTYMLPVSGESELLKNVGFETLRTNGGISEWTANGGVWNAETGVSVIDKSKEPTHVKSGDRSICIVNNMYEERGNVTQWVHLEPGAMYQASVWVYAAEPGRADARFSMAYWDAAHKKNPGGYQTSTYRYINQVGEWIQYIAHFEALEKGDNEVEFRIDLFGGDGVVYFDDASLYMIEPPKKMQFCTNEVLYYTEHQSGIMQAQVRADLTAGSGGTTVDFFVKDNMRILEERKSVPTENTARFIFDLTRLTIGKSYTAEAVLKDNNGTVLETQSIEIKRHLPRPRALTEEGYYKEQIKKEDGSLTDKLDAKGKPVYLDVMLAYTRPEDVSLLTKQGVTAYICGANSDVEKDNIGAELAKAEANNLKVLVGLYPNMKPAGHPDNIEISTYYIDKYKNHPAILGWAILDEPSAYFKEKELSKLMEDSYTLIRSLDPVHPAYAVEATTEYLPLVANYVDILASDPYPYQTNPIAGRTATYMREAANASDFRKPTASIVQLRELNGYFPTVTEVRNMYYHALFEGAGMLGFYAFNNAFGNQNLSQTDRWEGHVKFGQKEQKEAFDAFVYRKYPVFNASTKITDPAWYAGFVKDNSVYMYILNHDESNRSASARTVQVPLVSDGGRVRINGFTATLVYGEGETNIEEDGSILHVPLSKNGAVVYKITPHNKIDFSMLLQSTFRDLGRYGWVAEEIRMLVDAGIMEGITETSFCPSYNETTDGFAQGLASVLQISKTSLLSENGFFNDADLRREAMIKLMFSAAEKANLQVEAVLDTAALIRKNILSKKINTEDLVTRAESALVLSRIMKWKEDAMVSGTTNGKVYSDEVEMLALELANGAGELSEGIWKHSIETEKGTFLFLCNSSNVQETVIACQGEAVQQIYGQGEASLLDNRLRITFRGNGPVIIQVYKEAPFGLYRENKLLSKLDAGEVQIKHVDGKSLLAVYVLSEGKKELLEISDKNFTFVPKPGIRYELTALDWMDELRPKGKAYSIESE